VEWNHCRPGGRSQGQGRLASLQRKGGFLFPSLPPGHYSLTVGTATDVAEVTLGDGQRATVTKVVVP